MHIFILFNAVFFIIFLSFHNAANCPCDYSPLEIEHYKGQRILHFNNNSLNLCVVNAQPFIQARLKLVVLTDITIQFVAIDKISQKKECDVILSVTYSEKQTTPLLSQSRSLCPGMCRPIPEIDVSSEWLESNCDFTAMGNKMITCTLTASMIPFSSNSTSKKTEKLSLLLSAIFWRRTMECYENKFWQNRFKKLPISPFIQTTSSVLINKSNDNDKKILDSISKRLIFSIIIWIGSVSRLKLIDEQAGVLSGQPLDGINSVVGWAATDETYPCELNKVKCRAENQLAKYKYIPQSNVNFMSFGWGCAQRRPLRSLAHILTLVDPILVILLDDDTFLNYKLLINKYSDYLTHGSMTEQPLVIGDINGIYGDEGHITKWGIFLGGGGYILNRKTMERLLAYEIKYFESEGLLTTQEDIKYSDIFRSSKHVYHLSVSKEGMKASEKQCDKQDEKSIITSATNSRSVNGDTCVLSYTPTSRKITAKKSTEKIDGKSAVNSMDNKVIPIAVRLIDFCTNLMANENTCHHRYYLVIFDIL